MTLAIMFFTPVQAAHAQAAEQAEETTASEAPQESEAPKESDESSPEAQDADDPQSPRLRFADRRVILGRLGFGGNFQNDVLGDSKAKATYGVILRWDRPVHEYVTTGLSFSFYAAQPDGEFREPAFDVDYVLKGRYPFEMGRKERTFESEVYLLFSIGLTIWIDSAALDLNLIGPGWNVGLLVGYQFLFNDRIGLVAEVGWMRTEAFFSRGRFSILLNQATVSIGPVFPF